MFVIKSKPSVLKIAKKDTGLEFATWIAEIYSSTIMMLATGAGSYCLMQVA